MKPGAIEVGRTGKLTPTRAGLRALGKTLSAVDKAQRVRKRSAVYSVQLSMRYRDPAGNWKRKTLSPAGLPQPRAVASWRRTQTKEHRNALKKLESERKRLVVRERKQLAKAKMKKERRAIVSSARAKSREMKRRERFHARRLDAVSSDSKAFRDIVQGQMIGAVSRTIDSEKDIQGDTDSLLAELQSREASDKAIRRAMRDFKERRGLTFDVTVRKEI